MRTISPTSALYSKQRKTTKLANFVGGGYVKRLNEASAKRDLLELDDNAEDAVEKVLTSF